MNRSTSGKLSKHADCIYSILSVQRQATALELARKLALPRSIVNRVLYQELEPQQLVLHDDGTPPTWQTRVPTDYSSPTVVFGDEPWTLVTIDLGNVHDSLPRALALQANDPAHLCVRGYADFGYNGKELEACGNHVFRAHQNLANLADVQMIIDIVKFCISTDAQHPHPPSDVVIVSHDKIMHAFQTAMSLNFPNIEVHLVNTWNELKLLIE